MSTYLIAYDLIGSDKDYDDLIAKLLEWKGTRILESTWIISNRKESAKVIKNVLKALALDSNDKIIVIQITPDSKYASYNLEAKIRDLL